MVKRQFKEFASTKHCDIKKEEFLLMSFDDFLIEDLINHVGLNPGMNVPGMGSISIPSQPELPLSDQTPGSGDLLYIPPNDKIIQRKKKRKKKKISHLFKAD